MVFMSHYVWMKILYSKICEVISLNNSSLVCHHMTSLNSFHIGSGDGLLPVLKPRPCLKQPWFIIHYTSRFNEVERGHTGFTLSVCGQNRVLSVFSAILIGSISYLHILSSNFRECVACNVCSKIKKNWSLGEFCKFSTLIFILFWLGIQYESVVCVIMRGGGGGGGGYPQNVGIVVVLVWLLWTSFSEMWIKM